MTLHKGLHHNATRTAWSRALVATLLAVLLAACGRSEPTLDISASAGQVVQRPATPAVSYYAAARFAEQATMGPSPALVEEIQRLGFEAWIDRQFALPVTELAQLPKDGRDNDKAKLRDSFLQMTIRAPDQLRVKTTWSLSQFLVVSAARISGVATINYVNMLQREAFGNYRSILENVTLHPAMGWYLDNSFNKAKTDQCPWCELNENYARELMELFALGTSLINDDGSWRRDGTGSKINTYSQRDVENLARALTGWVYPPDELYGDEWADWRRPMIPGKDIEHDWGAKVLLGKAIPAGQDARKDLGSVLDIITTHGNHAPHVVKRLIQHFVKSNPSPAYVTRVVQVYRNNGRGAVGDMKAVIKAILLDAEARQGDDPRKSTATDGKFREPLLFQTHLIRALSCASWPTGNTGRPNYTGVQDPYMAETVFGFYSPHGIAAGTDLPAPEQTLVNTEEMRTRMALVADLAYSPLTSSDVDDFMVNLKNAGCAIDELNAKFERSTDEFLAHVGQLFFRGNMPASLKRELAVAIDSIKLREPKANRRAMQLLVQVALMSPQFGISR